MIDPVEIESRFSNEDSLSAMDSIFTEPTDEDLVQIDVIRDIMCDLPPREADFIVISEEDTLITRERHRQHLLQCADYLKNFQNKNDQKDFDKAAEDLRLATRHLGMIVGKVDVEEILGSIFNDFCIGK